MSVLVVSSHLFINIYYSDIYTCIIRLVLVTLASVLFESQVRTLSVRALTSKSNWVGNDLTVARRFQLLANN